MGERYWVTGVQLALLVHNAHRVELSEDIINHQLIGNFETDKDKKRFLKEIKKVR